MEKGQGKRTDTLPTDNVFTRKEYIERESALQALCEAVHAKDGNIPCRHQLVSCLWTGTRTQEYAEKILAIPAADVVPVRHGRWIISRADRAWNGAEYPTHCKCNQCGREIPYLDRDAYCPTCGALMDKDGDRE